MIGSHLMVEGGFNVNSTSVEAWTAFLASCREQSILVNEPGGGGVAPKKAEGALFSRSAIVLGESLDANPDDLARHYLGFRDLDDYQIRDLAEKVAEEVQKRGPFLSLGEFINRQLNQGDKDLSLRGALQAAIDATEINAPLAARGVPVTGAGGKGYAFPEAAEGNTATGVTGWLTQGDLLDSLGPLMTVRGDTFLIRGYGESRKADGSVVASALCEATVQRVPDYLDSADENMAREPESALNETFGRQFRMVSFRWVSKDEV